jgi:hypothetical protein
MLEHSNSYQHLVKIPFTSKYQFTPEWWISNHAHLFEPSQQELYQERSPSPPLSRYVMTITERDNSLIIEGEGVENTR